MGNAVPTPRSSKGIHLPPPDYETARPVVTLALHIGGTISKGKYRTNEKSSLRKYDYTEISSITMDNVNSFAAFLFPNELIDKFIKIGDVLIELKAHSQVKMAYELLGSVLELNMYFVHKCVGSKKKTRSKRHKPVNDETGETLSEFSDSDYAYEFDVDKGTPNDGLPVVGEDCFFSDELQRDELDGSEGDGLDGLEGDGLDGFDRAPRVGVEGAGKNATRVGSSSGAGAAKREAFDKDCALNDSDPDQASDVDVDCEERRDVRFTTFNPATIYNPHLQLGMSFTNKQELKIAIQSLAINEQRSVCFPCNDRRRLYSRCKDGRCNWRVTGLTREGNVVVITEFVREHTCAPSFKVKNVTSTWLAGRFKNTFRNDPKRDVNAFRVETMESLKVNVTKSQAYKTKHDAIRLAEGILAEQYEKLWDFGHEVRRSNPGSTVVIGADDSDGVNRFNRIYVCLHAMKVGFLEACRPVLCLDGCWLKGQYGGILLTAVGIDANNGYFPIAIAVVQKENSETWGWFLTLLKGDLNIVDTSVYTLMSDKQKGLVLAENTHFPGAEKRYCVRHLHANAKSDGYRSNLHKQCIWKCARAATPNEWERCMDNLRKADVAAAEWLNERHVSQYSRAYFRTSSRCAILTNNACEVFNSNIIDGRKKPIVNMLMWLIEYLMKRVQSNREEADKWEGPLCPRIQALIDETTESLGDCIPIKADNDHFQINCWDGSQYSVNLSAGTCGCRKWNLTGIPCKHALSAITFQNYDVVSYTHRCYRVESYKKCYELPILPMNGPEEWAKTDLDPPMPPNDGKRTKSRPVDKRRKEVDESSVQPKTVKRKTPPAVKKGGVRLKRRQTTLKCRLCGKEGHNARTCHLQPHPTVSTGAESAPASSTRDENGPETITGSDDGQATYFDSDTDALLDAFGPMLDEIAEEHMANTQKTQPNVANKGKEKVSIPDFGATGLAQKIVANKGKQKMHMDIEPSIEPRKRTRGTGTVKVAGKKGKGTVPMISTQESVAQKGKEKVNEDYGTGGLLGVQQERKRILRAKLGLKPQTTRQKKPPTMYEQLQVSRKVNMAIPPPFVENDSTSSCPTVDGGSSEPTPDILRGGRKFVTHADLAKALQQQKKKRGRK